MLNIKTINQNALFQNTFIFDHRDIQIIIDPGLNKDLIEKEVDFSKNTIILLTHYHFDHVLATDYLCSKFNIKAFISSDDKEWYINDDAYRPEIAPYLHGINVDSETRHHGNSGSNVVFFNNEIEDYKFIEIIKTPGHTAGSVIYKFGDDLFTGDTILHKSVGRVDLPGSSSIDLDKSINLFRSMPDNYIIHPGHGRSSSLKELKVINIYLSKK